MSQAPRRRSSRLVKIRTTDPVKPSRTRTSRQSVKPPIIISESSEEDNEVKSPLPHLVIDLAKNTVVSKKLTPPLEMEEKLPRTPHKTKCKSKLDENNVTPPKQRKFGGANNENVLVTPPTTPTIQLEKLSLMSPSEKSCRKKILQENTTDLYTNARRALHSTCPTNMPGREKELSELRQFISNHVEEGSSGTLYISGPPGTGKTASLNLILDDLDLKGEIKQVYVNCTSIKSSGSIFSRIAKDLDIKLSGKSEKEHVEAIERYLQKPHKTILLVLDEIDQLESKKQSVLYTIFEWPASPHSKLILIGIANALDLTDRILPRLQARCELKPQLMHFAPYTKQQIIEIFTNRLKSGGALDIFSPVALQMLAGKVAAISGDLRRALDIGRRVIELADKKKRGENVLKSVENFATELGNNNEEKGEEEKNKKVDLREVVAVLNNVYGTTKSFDEDEDAVPLQQKIIVCSLLLILKKAKNKDVTVGRLHEVYRKVCVKRNIQVVDQGEFVGLCSLIETRGIIKIIKKKDPRMSKVNLIWDQEEVAGGLKDKQLMSMILQDESCLGKL